MAYTADKPQPPPPAEELRARIPGWGADLDPKDRPSVPRERFDPGATGAHWDFPERQEEQWPRMFEHVRNGHLTPREMVTHRFPLENISEAYHVFSAKLDGCIKPLLLPSAS